MKGATIHSSEVHEVDSGIPPSPFSQKELFRKPTFNSLFDPFGSPSRGQKPQGREDVTALRCSEPLRSKVGGPSKVCAMVMRDGTARGRGNSEGGDSALLVRGVTVQSVSCYRCSWSDGCGMRIK